VSSRWPVKRAYPFSTHQYGYMNSSDAPTPVMPKTATAVASPRGGSCGRRPWNTSFHEKYASMRESTTAASTVIRVKRATFTMASRSSRS
jgi:hypothetical protein